MVHVPGNGDAPTPLPRWPSSMTTHRDIVDPATGPRRRASRPPVLLTAIATALGLTMVSVIGAGVLLAHEAAPAVTIEAPEDGFLAAVVGRDWIGGYAVVHLDARLDGDGTSWRWTSDAQPGALLNEREGTTRLYGAPCRVTQHRLTATALRPDGSWTSAEVVVQVGSTC